MTMTMNIDESLKRELGITSLNQIGIVIPDIGKAIDAYQSAFNLPAFRILQPKFNNKTYHGQSAEFSMKLAFSKWNSIDIELIEPTEGRSIYVDFLERNPDGGLHHLGYEVDDLDKSIEAFNKIGCKVLQGGRVEGGGHAYLDTEKRFGCILEVIHTPPGWPPEEDFI